MADDFTSDTADDFGVDTSDLTLDDIDHSSDGISDLMDNAPGPIDLSENPIPESVASGQDDINDLLNNVSDSGDISSDIVVEASDAGSDDINNLLNNETESPLSFGEDNEVISQLELDSQLNDTDGVNDSLLNFQDPSVDIQADNFDNPLVDATSDQTGLVTDTQTDTPDNPLVDATSDQTGLVTDTQTDTPDNPLVDATSDQTGFVTDTQTDTPDNPLVDVSSDQTGFVTDTQTDNPDNPLVDATSDQTGLVTDTQTDNPGNPLVDATSDQTGASSDVSLDTTSVQIDDTQSTDLHIDEISTETIAENMDAQSIVSGNPAADLQEKPIETDVIQGTEEAGNDTIPTITETQENHNLPENNEIVQNQENITQSDSTSEKIIETPIRQLDDFEQKTLLEKPDFYETGTFFEQGVNEFGYEGTCGPTSQANAINKLLGTNEMTENKVLSMAVDNNLCTTTGSVDEQGGTTTSQFMTLYEKINENMGDKLQTELYENDNALDLEQVANKLDEGSVINVAVDSKELWDQRQPSMFANTDSSYTDHWITVSGVHRDDLGGINGFDVIDSGGKVNFVDAEKYEKICFGSPEHKVLDPTCIVVSKKTELPQK